MSNIKSTQYPNIEIEYILTIRGKEEMRGTQKQCSLKFYGLDRNEKAFATITPVMPVQIAFNLWNMTLTDKKNILVLS